jgi:hypothetical protein
MHICCYSGGHSGNGHPDRVKPPEREESDVDEN